jgi:hypothetical protein
VRQILKVAGSGILIGKKELAMPGKPRMYMAGMPCDVNQGRLTESPVPILEVMKYSQKEDGDK